MRLGVLQTNNITNVVVKFEQLAAVDIEDRVIYQGKEGALRDTILQIKHNKA